MISIYTLISEKFLIITDLGEPCECALTITENHRGGTENHRVFYWFSLWFSADSLWPSVASLWPSVIFKGMLSDSGSPESVIIRKVQSKKLKVTP